MQPMADGSGCFWDVVPDRRPQGVRAAEARDDAEARARGWEHLEGDTIALLSELYARHVQSGTQEPWICPHHKMLQLEEAGDGYAESIERNQRAHLKVMP